MADMTKDELVLIKKTRDALRKLVLPEHVDIPEIMYRFSSEQWNVLWRAQVILSAKTDGWEANGE